MKTKYKVMILAMTLLFFALVGTVLAEPLYYESLRRVKYNPVCSKSNQPYFVLVSWNMGEYSTNKTRKALETMADILRDADIVVLQNIQSSQGTKMDIKKIAQMLDMKDKNWDFITSEKVDGKGDLAFLWDTKKISIHNVHMIRTSRSCGHYMEHAPVIGSFIFNKEKFQIVSFIAASSEEKAQKEISDYIGCDRFNRDSLIALGDFNLPPGKVNPLFREYGFVNQTESRRSMVKNKINRSCSHRTSSHIFTKNSSVDVCASGVVDLANIINDHEDVKNVSEHMPVFIIFQPKKATSKL